MAFVYVTEYNQLGLYGEQQVPLEPPIADYRMAIPGTGPAFQSQTRFVRIHADAICSIAIGPVATVAPATTNQRFAANQTEYKAVPQGASYAVANVSNT